MNRISVSLAALALSGCATYAPVAPSRPLVLQRLDLGQAVFIQDDRVVSPVAAVRALASVDASAAEARTATRWHTAGFVGWFGGAAAVGVGAGIGRDDRAAALATVAGGVALMAGGVWAYCTGRDHLEAATARYNAAVTRPAPPSSAGLRVHPTLAWVPGTRSPRVGAAASLEF